MFDEEDKIALSSTVYPIIAGQILLCVCLSIVSLLVLRQIEETIALVAHLENDVSADNHKQHVPGAPDSPLPSELLDESSDIARH